jgi:hypothetical protein
MLRVTLCTLALLLGPLRLVAAQDERWQVTLGGDRYVWDVRLVRLDGDSLVLRQSDSLLRVPVAQMTEIRLIRKTEVEVGTGNADAAAMAALTGSDDEIYDLTPLDFAARLRAVQKVLVLHPPAEH